MFFFTGRRIFGIRPGVIFGPGDFRRAPRVTAGGQMEGSFVYVLRGDHNMTKIGVSTNPNARLASLRTASAFPIDFAFVGVTPGTGYDIEKRAHDMLANHRCNGEWFDVTPEMAVAAVHGAAHQLGQPIQPLKPEWVDQILKIVAAGGNAASAKAPWWRSPWRWALLLLIFWALIFAILRSI